MKSFKILTIVAVLFTSIPAFAQDMGAEPPVPTAPVAPPATQKTESKAGKIAMKVAEQTARVMVDIGVVCVNGFMKGWMKPLPQNSPQDGQSGSARITIGIPGAQVTAECDHCGKTH